VGLAFITTGMLGMALGLIEHNKLLKQIKSERYVYYESHSVEIVAITLLIIGLVSFIGLIVKYVTFGW
jgi:putative membrane protein